MRRSEFLKSIAAIIAAPSAIVGIAEALQPLTIPKTTHLVAAYFKITRDMYMDAECMRYLTENKDSDLYRNARRHGIDTDKEMEFKMGYMKNDFIKNCFTILILQYQ